MNGINFKDMYDYNSIMQLVDEEIKKARINVDRKMEIYFIEEDENIYKEMMKLKRKHKLN